MNEFPKLSLDEILNGRKRAQKSIPICLRLDVLAEIEELERSIQAEPDAAEDDLRIVDVSNKTQYAEKIRELEAIAHQYTVDLRVEALERQQWSDEVGTYTETQDNGDTKLNIAGLVEHVLTLPGVITAPVMSTDQIRNLIAGLSDGQWERVMNDVFNLNRRTVDVGKSLTASLAMQPKNEKPGPVAK